MPIQLVLFAGPSHRDTVSRKIPVTLSWPHMNLSYIFLFLTHFIVTLAFTSRGKSGGRKNLVVTLNFKWTQLTAKSEFQMTTTEHGFHLKSGFRKIFWPPDIDLVFFQDSQKYCVHQKFLYTEVQWMLGNFLTLWTVHQCQNIGGGGSCEEWFTLSLTLSLSLCCSVWQMMSWVGAGVKSVWHNGTFGATLQSDSQTAWEGAWSCLLEQIRQINLVFATRVSLLFPQQPEF